MKKEQSKVEPPLEGTAKERYQAYLKEHKRKLRELLWIQYGDYGAGPARYEDDYE